MTDLITYMVELSNKIHKGRAVGNLYGVSKVINGCRAGWELEPQTDIEVARSLAFKMNGYDRQALNLKPGSMTPEQVASLRDGSKVQFNLDVHMDHGANPKTWGKSTEIRIKSRGVTADCHPLGGGLPFVQYEYVLSRDESGKETGWIHGSIGVGNRHVRIVEV